MSTIVPYIGAVAPRAALYGYRAASRIQRAYRSYRFAKRVYRRTMPYVRYAKRRYRGVARARKRMRFTPPNYISGTSTSKRREVANDNVPLLVATRTLFTTDLGSIPHTATNDVSARQRNLLNMRGTKICMEMANQTNDALYVNVAVVVPLRATSVTNTDFFRSSVGNTRSTDFNATALTGLEFHCLPINSDKHRVLWHKRFRLTPRDTTGGLTDHQGRSYMTIEKYIKYKRQLRFANNTDAIPEGASPFLIYWCSGFGTSLAAGSTASALQVTRRFVTYFREPKP